MERFAMPMPVTNELIYEVLKNLQERMGNLGDDMSSVKTRLTSIDTRLGLVHTDMAQREASLNIDDPRH